MYTIQFWHGKDAAWKATGSGTFYDKSQAISQMRKLGEMCDFCVRFRVTEAVTL